MNNKGQVWGYTISLGLVIIILALALAPSGNEFVKNAMNQTTGDMIGMDCSNSSISNFQKAGCTVTDFSVAYFFGGLILIGGIVLTARLIFE